ncbi:MAG: hypothetical protein IPK82_12335 [Polyangiaceae bacterium]|nr:hypothetical protein [Polyangiaceae bacterium]
MTRTPRLPKRSRRAPLSVAVLFFTLIAVLLGAPADAPAEPPEAPPSDMNVYIAPLLSANPTQMPWGWGAIVVGVTNNSSAPTRGEVIAKLGQFSGRGLLEVKAPYAVPAGGKVMVRLPVDVPQYSQITVQVIDEKRGRISPPAFALGVVDPSSAVLVDTSGSQLKGAIIDTPIATTYDDPTHRASGSTLTIGVVNPQVDPATGDPLLPDRASLYSMAEAVLFRSDMLARLSGSELSALAGYVLAGGTLAVAVTRPEDIRNPTIAALVGGEVAQTSISSEALRPLVLDRLGSGVPVATAPSDAIRESLGGFRGGNLRGSAYGNSAAYGLGEVHLLAFDPTRKPALDDPWVRVRMIDLVRRAYDRRAQVVFRQGGGDPNVDLSRVRKQLDPNENSRWAIAIAALLLLVYAVLAAPANYAVAAKRNKPLSALKVLPIFSAVTFFIIVGVGIFAKGVSGRARHLSLVEAGAGMSKAAIRRYRSFYASRARELTVRTTDTTSLVRTVIVSEPGEIDDKLVIDREGARLENVNALPWQTIVMREDGLVDIGEGIAIVKGEGAQAKIKNLTGHPLRSAILRLPGTFDLRYFAKIEDGATVESTQGRELGTESRDRPWVSALAATHSVGATQIRNLNAYALGSITDGDAPGLADAWWAMEDASHRDSSWFVDDVPVLLAQMDGGEGRTSDAGLRLESDRLLVRVVGWGGAL